VSERTDQKLREVAIAWYAFRHEAEFAAGFLDDAGIPYRMQLDDPVLGSGMSSNATIWVLGMHERQAREVLELDGERVHLSGGSSATRVTAPARAGTIRPPSAPRGPGWETSPTLSLRERGLGLLGAGGMLALLRLFLQEGMHPIVSGGVVLVSALFAVAGIAGWAPAPLRRLLRALSGGAP
jgi:hypothetical protein